MPKKNLLISATLTAFVLVISFGVVNAFKQANAITEVTQSAPVVEQVVMVDPTQEPAPVNLIPQEAALVAANYLQQTDIYSVEISNWDGNEAYKVVFSSGDTVYVSFTGEIVGTEAPKTVVITAPSSSSGSNSAPAYDDDDDESDHDEDEFEDERDD